MKQMANIALTTPLDIDLSEPLKLDNSARYMQEPADDLFNSRPRDFGDTQHMVMDIGPCAQLTAMPQTINPEQIPLHLDLDLTVSAAEFARRQNVVPITSASTQSKYSAPCRANTSLYARSAQITPSKL
jgi:hypothetical protein